MASPKWITPAGFLGTVTARTSISIPFTVTEPDASFSVITGRLPSGLVLQQVTTSTTTSTTGFIIGNPTSVPTSLRNEFVIRAKNSSGIGDRTFILETVGAVDPTWITPTGFLSVGTSGECFAVNKNIVDYQLSAVPNVLLSNMKLRYFIADGDGQLPKGLTLTEDGRITGIIDEITVIDNSVSVIGNGYDTEKYDQYPYDNTVIIEERTSRPKFIKKIYQFYVTVSDGFNTARKEFKIQVVDVNSLRGDTGYISADARCFQAGNSYLYAPAWLSPANLGIKRAANYQIVTLKTYDAFPELGPVTWSWDDVSVNPEIKVVADTRQILPTDSSNSSTWYYPKFNRVGDSSIYLKDLTSLPQVGHQFRLDSYVKAAFTTTYTITSVTGTTALCQIGFKHSPKKEGQNIIYRTDLLDDIDDNEVFFIGSPVSKPLGLELNPETGDLYGKVPYIPAYSLDYKFTVRMTRTDIITDDTNKSDRVFQLKLQGSLDTDLKWITTSTVGVIRSGYQSELNIKAEHEEDLNLGIQYKLVDGELPEGLSFKVDGSIVGKIPYGKTTEIDYFLPTDFKIDNGETTIDREYKFRAEATNIYRTATIDKEFVIRIGENNPTPFSSVYVRPFMYRSKRKSYRDFINDRDIFDVKDLYRSTDPAFGIQRDIKMVLEYGIQRLNLAEYVVGLQNYFYNKRFYFGDIKVIAAEDDKRNHVYDLVYVDIIDSTVSSFGKSPDSVSFLINQQLVDYYANSVDNWKNRLESITIYGEKIQVDEMLRPRFMRTIQQTTGAPLGFIKAVPICYAKPGAGTKILRKMQLSGFDFKLLDFEVDRLIIDNTTDYVGDKYLKFPIKNIDDARPLNVLAGPDGVIITDENGIALLVE